MNYTEALEYIHGISWTFCKPGLERIGELCRKLGHPERKLRFIHIAGTNGKGSSSAMLASILHAAGYKVGLFTSPYVRVFNERMRIGTENISDSELAEITSHVRPFADAMEDRPTEFELISAIAFEYFARNMCDVVVLEAGMGGRLDSTNIIGSSLLSVITGIALDHVAFLGDTVEKIAAEKAGIIKQGCPVLFGGDDDAADAVIRAEAQKTGAEYARTDRATLAVKSFSLKGSEFDFLGYKDVKISLLGSYQPRNAATVITAVEMLKKRGMQIPENAVREGLASTRWPARFELLSESPTVIFDGAHNAEGVSAATESIKLYFKDKKVSVISGVLSDKDYGAIADDISKIADCVFTITPENPRALSAREYADVFSARGVCAVACASVNEALSSALEKVKTDGRALVCLGSLYTYSSVMEFFSEGNNDL